MKTYVDLEWSRVDDLVRIENNVVPSYGRLWYLEATIEQN